MGLFLFNSKLLSVFTDNHDTVLLKLNIHGLLFCNIIAQDFKKIKTNFNKISYVHRNNYHELKAEA